MSSLIQQIISYKINSLPDSGQGALYLDQSPVTTGQEILSISIDQLNFTPTPTFTGASFSYLATDGTVSSSRPLIVNLIRPNGVNGFDGSGSEILVSTVIIEGINNTFVPIPTDLESNAITIVKTSDDDFTYNYQLKNILRRLKSDQEIRLSLELSDRAKVYR